jgi:hypothetical protein
MGHPATDRTGPNPCSAIQTFGTLDQPRSSEPFAEIANLVAGKGITDQTDFTP